jgi:hypothetical protein
MKIAAPESIGRQSKPVTSRVRKFQKQNPKNLAMVLHPFPSSLVLGLALGVLF